MTPEYRNDLLELYQQQDIDSQDEGEYRDEIICDNERYDAMELDY